MSSLKIGEPRVQGKPTASSRSLNAKGRPCSGPTLSPFASCRSASSARARHRSSSSFATIAFTRGFTRAIRARCAFMTSRAESLRARTSRASSRPLVKQRSLEGPGVAGGAVSAAAPIATVTPAACRNPRRSVFIGGDLTPLPSTCPRPCPAYDAAVGIRPVVLLVPSRAAAVELPRRLAASGPGLTGVYPFKVLDLARAVAEPSLLGRGLKSWDAGHDALLAARLLDEDPSPLVSADTP